jgi:hypothetical protein
VHLVQSSIHQAREITFDEEAAANDETHQAADRTVGSQGHQRVNSRGFPESKSSSCLTMKSLPARRNAGPLHGATQIPSFAGHFEEMNGVAGKLAECRFIAAELRFQHFVTVLQIDRSHGIPKVCSLRANLHLTSREPLPQLTAPHKKMARRSIADQSTVRFPLSPTPRIENQGRPAEATRRALTSVAGPRRCEPQSRWPSSDQREPQAACRG